MFAELEINEIEIHGRLNRILRKAPTVAIPIDSIPGDLTEWVQTLRNTVKIWVLEKYVSTADSTRVLYSIPEENVPTLTSRPTDGGVATTVRSSASEVWRELLAAVPALLNRPLYLEYGPRGSPKKTFQGIVREGGIEIDGTVYSPSYAAVECMRQAGSQRRTANGWTMWKTVEGELIDDVYERIKQQTPIEK
jgi:hypothetical protein